MTASDADRAKAAEVLRCTTLGFDPRAAEVDRIAAAIAEARASERAAADQLRADMEKLAEEWLRDGSAPQQAIRLRAILDAR